MTDMLILAMITAVILVFAGFAVHLIDKNHKLELSILRDEQEALQNALNQEVGRNNALSSENAQLKSKIAENAKKAAQEARHIKNLNCELSKTKAQLKRAKNALAPSLGKQKTDSA
jgi:septal ring factor EnvC (AmiA/AmiB activator)